MGIEAFFSQVKSKSDIDPQFKEDLYSATTKIAESVNARGRGRGLNMSHFISKLPALGNIYATAAHDHLSLLTKKVDNLLGHLQIYAIIFYCHIKYLKN